MILTLQERKRLGERLFSKNDIIEIERAAKKTKYAIADGDGELPISRDQAIRLLGREGWLSGLCRSAFHINARRTAPGGETVLFNSIELCR